MHGNCFTCLFVLTDATGHWAATTTWPWLLAHDVTTGSSSNLIVREMCNTPPRSWLLLFFQMPIKRQTPSPEPPTHDQISHNLEKCPYHLTLSSTMLEFTGIDYRCPTCGRDFETKRALACHSRRDRACSPANGPVLTGDSSRKTKIARTSRDINPARDPKTVSCFFLSAVSHPWKLKIPMRHLPPMILFQPMTQPTTVTTKTNCQSKPLRHPSHQISTMQTLEKTHRVTPSQPPVSQMDSTPIFF